MAAPRDEQNIAEAIGDIVVTLGLRTEAHDIVEHTSHLISEPITLYKRHPNWPSGATVEGTPIEISIVADADRAPSVRYIVDVADHRRGIGDNWNRYLEAAAHIAGTSSQMETRRLWSLLVEHLNGIDHIVSPPLLLGRQFNGDGTARAKLYFTTRDLPFARLLRRFPHYANSIRSSLHDYNPLALPDTALISYDLSNDLQVERTKFYWSVPQRNVLPASLTRIAQSHPDTIAAGNVLQHFRSSYNPAVDIVGILQLAFRNGSDRCDRRLGFTASAFGWDQPKGMLALIGYLADEFGMTMSPLYAALGVFAEHGIRVDPTYVVIGPGSRQPSIKLYLAPVIEDALLRPPAHQRHKSLDVERGTADERHKREAQQAIEILDGMCASATDYLATGQEGGRWSDFGVIGDCDQWVTGWILAGLVADPGPTSLTTLGAEWLLDMYRPGMGWGASGSSGNQGDIETTSLVLLALQRSRVGLPVGATQILEDRLARRLSGREGSDSSESDWIEPAEVLATALHALLEAGAVDPVVLRATVTRLLSLQRLDGGWSAGLWKDDIVGTYRCLRALQVYSAADGSGSTELMHEDVAKAIQAAHFSLSAQVVAAEPFALGLWLSALSASGAKPRYPGVYRALYHLWHLQQRDGSWLSVPIRHLSARKAPRPWSSGGYGQLCLDERRHVTTATALEGLQWLRRMLEIPEGTQDR